MTAHDVGLPSPPGPGVACFSCPPVRGHGIRPRMVAKWLHVFFLAWRLSQSPTLALDHTRDAFAVTDDEWELEWLTRWCWHEGRYDPASVSRDAWTEGACQVAPTVWGPVPYYRVEQYGQAIRVIRDLRDYCVQFGRDNSYIALARNPRRASLLAYSIGTCYGEEPAFMTWRCTQFDCDEPKPAKRPRTTDRSVVQSHAP